MLREERISFASSAQASKARDSERTRVLSQSKRRVVIYSRQWDVIERGGEDGVRKLWK